MQIFKKAQGSNKLLSPLLRVVIRPSFPAILKFCLLKHLFVVYTQTFLVQSEFLLGKKHAFSVLKPTEILLRMSTKASVIPLCVDLVGVNRASVAMEGSTG